MVIKLALGCALQDSRWSLERCCVGTQMVRSKVAMGAIRTHHPTVACHSVLRGKEAVGRYASGTNSRRRAVAAEHAARGVVMLGLLVILLRRELEPRLDEQPEGEQLAERTRRRHEAAAKAAHRERRCFGRSRPRFGLGLIYSCDCDPAWWV